MLKMSLYDLPKDMLVYLISTVKYDLEKENEQLKKDIEAYEFLGAGKKYCRYLDCKSMSYFNCGEQKVVNCNKMFDCDICGDIFCDEHLYYHPKLYLCLKCKNSDQRYANIDFIKLENYYK